MRSPRKGMAVAGNISQGISCSFQHDKVNHMYAFRSLAFFDK